MRLTRLASFAAALSAGLFAHQSIAAACGGLFCNASQPVNQAAERILFVENGDGTVSAIIEIQYQGPASSFSWVLPVPGVPEVSVSSVNAFDRLQQATNPTYSLNTTFEDCGDEESFGRGGGFPTSAPGVDDDGVSDGGNGGVDVLAMGTVGPFDYEVISVDPSLSDAAAVAVDWLTENGYDVTTIGPDVLRPYLEADLNLIAFRLTKQGSTGSVRPVVITYDASLPFIPIRPTAVAANADMGILVWVVSQDRAIPENYKALELNDARINWFNPMSTYNDVVIDAANEAGGQGFVTELASESAPMLDQTVLQSWEESEWTRIGSTQYATAVDLYVDASGYFGGWDGFRDALASALPEGASVDNFVGCPYCYADDPAYALDTNELRLAIYEDVIKPMQDFQALLTSRRYVTRFYTTMSADEMTMDPAFDFNPDLPDISNIHTADQLIACDGSYQIRLPQGGVVYGEEQGTWPVDTLGEQPAARVIRQLSRSGEGEVVEDHSALIAGLINASNTAQNAVITLDAGFDDSPSTTNPDGGPALTGSSGGDDGCSVHGTPRKGSLASVYALLAALGLAFYRRRNAR